MGNALPAFSYKICIIVILLSSETYNFNVITSYSCPGCVEKIDEMKKIFPQSTFLLNDIADKKNLEKFSKINSLIGDIFLPLPLFGVFKDDQLTAIISGNSDNSNYTGTLNLNYDGVPLFIEDEYGEIKVEKIFTSRQDIVTLQDIFLERESGEIFKNYQKLLIPIIMAAFIDAVNPCAFSILLVLLAFIFYSNNRKDVVKIGLSFTLATYLSYFVIGLGLIQVMGKITYIRPLIAIFTILFGFLSILEFFSGERGHIPKIFSQTISYYLEKISNPRNAFFTGLLTGMLILPCSSGPYFLAISLINANAAPLGGIILLLIYNLIIITPFVIITFLINGLFTYTRDIRLLLKENRKWLNLFVGIGLILLSVVTLVYL